MMCLRKQGGFETRPYGPKKLSFRGAAIRAKSRNPWGEQPWTLGLSAGRPSAG